MEGDVAPPGARYTLLDQMIALSSLRCPDCGCLPQRHNAVNRVSSNPFGGPLVIAHCGEDGSCWRTTEEFTQQVLNYLRPPK